MKLALFILTFCSFTSIVFGADFLCVKKADNDPEVLVEQTQKILNKINPEYNSLCYGLQSSRLLLEDSDADVREKNRLDQIYKTKNFFAQSKSEYCSRTPEEMIKSLCVNKGKLGFDNEGGLFGLETGVCWWHSRFHRKMNYLTYFNPSKTSNYSDDEVEEIIRRIDHNKVTSIDGYDHFQEFIQDSNYPGRKKVLQKYLQKQMGKSTLKFEWLKGLKGKANVARKRKVRPRKLNKQRRQQLTEISKMKEQLIVQKKTPYMMVQHPGVKAHSFIVYDFIDLTDKLGNEAFKIRVQNSQTQNGGTTSFGENDYVFDVKSAQWYTDTEYEKLVDKRLNPSKNIEEAKSQDWTLWNQHNTDMDHINDAYSEECGRSLFK